MNARNLPLSALLMTAALAAQAQLLNPNVGGPFNLSNPGLSGTASSSSADILNDDMTYKCSTVPYRPCTADELNRQENVKRAGKCPMSPATDACASFLMRTSVSANPAQTIAAYTPPPGQKWASPDCQRIPCALAPDDSTTVDEIVVTAPRRPNSQSQEDPGFIGPPCPPDICPGQGGGSNNAQWDSQFEAIKEMAEKNGQQVISTGNGRYIQIDPSDPSKVRECTVMMCKKDPVDAGKYADQIQAANANAAMFNVNSASNKKTSPPPAQQDPIDPNPKTGGATADASDVITAMRSMGRGGDGETTTGSSWTGTGSGGGTGGTGGQGGDPGASQTVKIAGSEISHPDDIPVTFVANQKMAGVIQAAHSGVDSGANEALVTTGGQTSAELRGRMAEPPVDAATVGKQQWVPGNEKK